MRYGLRLWSALRASAYEYPELYCASDWGCYMHHLVLLIGLRLLIIDDCLLDRLDE